MAVRIAPVLQDTGQAWRSQLQVGDFVSIQATFHVEEAGDTFSCKISIEEDV
jgi:hypothetical protein